MAVFTLSTRPPAASLQAKQEAGNPQRFIGLRAIHRTIHRQVMGVFHCNLVQLDGGWRPLQFSPTGLHWRRLRWLDVLLTSHVAQLWIASMRWCSFPYVHHRSTINGFVLSTLHQSLKDKDRNCVAINCLFESAAKSKVLSWNMHHQYMHHLLVENSPFFCLRQNNTLHPSLEDYFFFFWYHMIYVALSFYVKNYTCWLITTWAGHFSTAIWNTL